MAVSTTQSIWRSGGGDQTRTAYCGNGTMVALIVDSREKVDKLYRKALELGGADEGARVVHAVQIRNRLEIESVIEAKVIGDLGFIHERNRHRPQRRRAVGAHRRAVSVGRLGEDAHGHDRQTDGHQTGGSERQDAGHLGFLSAGGLREVRSRLKRNMTLDCGVPLP